MFLPFLSKSAGGRSRERGRSVVEENKEKDKNFETGLQGS